MIFVFNVQNQTCEECASAYGDSEGVVCGKDGRTYLSKCFAKCSKVNVWYEGRCTRHNCP